MTIARRCSGCHRDVEPSRAASGAMRCKRCSTKKTTREGAWTQDQLDELMARRKKS